MVVRVGPKPEIVKLDKEAQLFVPVNVVNVLLEDPCNTCTEVTESSAANCTNILEH